MKAVVDADLCVGCAECEEICPEVFQLEEDLAKVILDPVPPEYEKTCREAADACPVEAINLEE